MRKLDRTLLWNQPLMLNTELFGGIYAFEWFFEILPPMDFVCIPSHLPSRAPAGLLPALLAPALQLGITPGPRTLEVLLRCCHILEWNSGCQPLGFATPHCTATVAAVATAGGCVGGLAAGAGLPGALGRSSERTSSSSSSRMRWRCWLWFLGRCCCDRKRRGWS